MQGTSPAVQQGWVCSVICNFDTLLAGFVNCYVCVILLLTLCVKKQRRFVIWKTDVITTAWVFGLACLVCWCFALYLKQYHLGDDSLCRGGKHTDMNMMFSVCIRWKLLALTALEGVARCGWAMAQRLYADKKGQGARDDFEMLVLQATEIRLGVWCFVSKLFKGHCKLLS